MFMQARVFGAAAGEPDWLTHPSKAGLAGQDKASIANEGTKHAHSGQRKKSTTQRQSKIRRETILEQTSF